MEKTKKKSVKYTKDYWLITGILLTAAIVFLLFSVWLGGTLVGKIRQRVRSTSIQVISELTDKKAKVLVGILNETEKDMKIIAGYLGEETDPGKKDMILKRFHETHGMDSLAVKDKDGSYIYGSEDEMALNGIPDEFEQEVIEQGKAMSDAVFGKSGKRQILYGTAIPGGGCIYAALAAEDLEKTYGETTYLDEGYSYIVRADGSIILPPVQYSYEQIFGNIKKLLEDNKNSRESVEEFLDALQEGKAGSVVFHIDDKDQLLCFEPLQVGKNWEIITAVPLSVVEEDGNQIIRMSAYMAGSIVAALFIVFAVGTGFYFASRRKKHENEVFLGMIYQAISENTDTVIFILDAQSGKLDYVFENSMRILGIGAEEFLSGKVSAESIFKEKLTDILNKERPKERRISAFQAYNDRLKKEMWLKVLDCPVYLGDSLKYIYAVTDVTEEHKARENITAAVVAAEQANAAKSQFLANMSHDIRTPMNGIVGMTSIARMNLNDRERVADCLDKIDMSSRLLLGLINDVLDMSKIESGKLVLSRDPFDLSELFQNLQAIFQNQCIAKDQKFFLETNVVHSRLLGDSVRLNQIFSNLISNAIKFTPEGGKIVVTIQELPQKHAEFAHFRFQVRDNGIGMEPEFQKHIFTPFERADDKSVRKTEGTGLGMAITKNLVTAMGGQIMVESVPEKGSVFTVEMELTMQEPEQLEKPGIRMQEESLFDYRGKRFLLAEDNALNQEIVQELLGEQGAEVEAAGDGKEALELFLSREPGYYDAVLLDIQMPVMDGYEAARQIRGSGYSGSKKIPVIAMTANAFTEDIQAARAAGMDGHVAKPIDVSEISKALKKALEKHTEEKNQEQG